MKCLIYFGTSSMKEGTSAQLSGRGELHGGARVTTLVTLRKCTLGNKREIKTLKFVLASTKGFKGGLAWIKPSKKDMAVTFSYYPQSGSALQTSTHPLLAHPCSWPGSALQSHACGYQREQICSHPASVCLVDHLLYGICPNVMTLGSQRRAVAYYSMGE